MAADGTVRIVRDTDADYVGVVLTGDPAMDFIDIVVDGGAPVAGDNVRQKSG